MQKVKKLLFLYINFLLAIIAVVYLSGWFKKTDPQQNIRLSTSTHALIEAASLIERYWQQGNWPLEMKKCKGLSELLGYVEQHALDQARFLQCEPKALECYLASLTENPIQVHSFDRVSWEVSSTPAQNQKLLAIRYHQDPEVRSAAKLYFFQLMEISSKTQQLFSLEDSCRDRKLKESLHPYGEQKPVGQDFIWDNRGRSLYIDRFLVSRGEFFDWLNQLQTSHPFVSDKLEGLERFQIVDNIPLHWQKKYCEAQGKTLLQSHIADGASFFPAQLQSDQIMVYPRGPFPQGRRRLDSYIGEIVDDANKEIDLTKLCREVFTLECAGIYGPVLARFPFGLSYQGIEQVLGGVPESSANKIEPNRRVQLSSAYFSVRNEVHRLGKRYLWDGENFDSGAFEVNLSDEEEPLPLTLGIGFRCMRVK
jgi:hypothetical protein